MRLYKEMQIEKVCDAEASRRYALGGVQVDFKAGMLRATDGRIAVEVPIVSVSDEELELPETILPAAAVTMALAQPKGTGHSITVNGNVSVLTKKLGQVSFDALKGTFPHVSEVWQEKADDDLVLQINAALLWRISQAFGVEGVELRLKKNGFKRRRAVDGKVIVEPIPYSLPIGIEPVGLDVDDALGRRATLMPIVN